MHLHDAAVLCALVQIREEYPLTGEVRRFKRRDLRKGMSQTQHLGHHEEKDSQLSKVLVRSGKSKKSKLDFRTSMEMRDATLRLGGWHMYLQSQSRHSGQNLAICIGQRLDIFLVTQLTMVHVLTNVLSSHTFYATIRTVPAPLCCWPQMLSLWLK